MNWAQAYPRDNQPSLEEMSGFVKSPLWGELCLFITETYTMAPKTEYSSCSAQKGWNVKYRKGGKSLCVLYPMDGYFIALVVASEKAQVETELVISGCCEYVRGLYEKTPYFRGSKWLMIDVKDADALRDVKALMALRMRQSS